jgi:hypothetical protein
MAGTSEAGEAQEMPTTKRPTRKAYIIQESGWDYNDEYYYRGGSADDQVIAAFTDRSKAEVYRREREERARRGKNPFEYVTYWPSSRTEEEVVRLVEEMGLPAPEFAHGCYQWLGWWPDQYERMSGEQRARVWEAMDLVRFFEVIEIDVEG